MRKLASVVLLIVLGFISHDVFAGKPSGLDTVNVDVSFYTPPPQQRLQNPPGSEIRNVIFMIGDGMGMVQIAAARIYAVGPDRLLNIDRLPVTGLVKTHSANQLITDSAAGATALSTGVKTNNGVIGLSPQGDTLQTVLERLKREGKATGLVVTSTITHATPAGFAAHVSSRKNEPKIAEQLLRNRVNVLLGGGRMFFLPESAKGSKRPDNRDLLAEAVRGGYQVVETRDQLAAARGPFLLGLFAAGGLTTKPPEPSLAEMTAKALDILSQNPRGFFLMVEGSQIDWACHANDANYEVRQMLLFDQAVGKALDFARRDGHTLVVITADHETGGMAINGGSRSGRPLAIAWTTTHHTGVNVPVFAYGPGAGAFSGVHDNTEIPRILARLLRLKDFPAR